MDIIDVYKSTFRFMPSSVFKWAPSEDTIYYNQSDIASKSGYISLLHEISHALLKHENFQYDVDLIQRETEAWSKTRELSVKHAVDFDESYADNCLETYRTWIYNRSSCPNCHQTSVEHKPQSYRCFNCFSKWSVSKDQNCQIQRRRIK